MKTEINGYICVNAEENEVLRGLLTNGKCYSRFYVGGIKTQFEEVLDNYWFFQACDEDAEPNFDAILRMLEHNNIHGWLEVNVDIPTSEYTFRTETMAGIQF